MGIGQGRRRFLLEGAPKNHDEGLALIKSALAAGAWEFEHAGAVLRADNAELYA